MTALPCHCLADRIKALASENTEFVMTWCSDTRLVTPTLATREIVRSGREAVPVVPLYCPFCGTPYPTKPEDLT